MSKLKELMEYLNPRTIIEKTEIPHDNARASITLQSSTVRNYKEFEDMLVAYVSHHTKMILGTSLPPELCLDKARKFLDSSIGWENSVYISMSGDQGGLPGCLNEINDQFKKESKNAYFSFYLSILDPLNYPEILEVMKEIKDKISAFSPESFKYISPEQLSMNYKDVIYKYIETISRHRNLWDYYSG